MMNSQGEANRLKSLNALTALRFFAAAIIVIHHSKGSFGLDSQWLMDLPTVQPVSFFFVLSGFILAYVYPSLKSIKDVRQFLIARFARIWPLHVATFLLVILLFPGYLRTPGGQDTPSLILTNLFMVQAWIPIWNYYFSYNWLSWAISTEFFFYLLFPWFIYAWHRTWHIKLLCAFLLVSAIICYANMVGLPSGQATGTTGQVGYSGLVYIGPLGRLFEFTLGMTLALFYTRKKSFYNPGRIFGTIIEGVVLIMAVGVMAWSNSIAHLIIVHYPWSGISGISWLVCGGLPCGFYGVLILMMAMEKGLISHLLSWGFFRGLGEMSLSIFLLHQILIRYYQWRIENTTDLPNWFFYGYLWVVLLLGSYVLMVLIERPCRQFILGLSQHNRRKRNSQPVGNENLLLGTSSISAFGKVLSSWLIRKRQLLLTVSALSILLIFINSYLPGALTLKNVIDQKMAAKIIDNWDAKYQRIQFGNKFLLRGANLVKMPGRIKLQLIWESMNEERLKYSVAVHFLDTGGRILSGADYPQNRGHILVHNHTIWLEETVIPLKKLTGASAIGIALYSTETREFLSPDRGERDWNNQRLKITLPEQP